MPFYAKGWKKVWVFRPKCWKSIYLRSQKAGKLSRKLVATMLRGRNVHAGFSKKIQDRSKIWQTLFFLLLKVRFAQLGPLHFLLSSSLKSQCFLPELKRTSWTGDMTPSTWQNHWVAKLLGLSIRSVSTLEQTILNSDVMMLRRRSSFSSLLFEQTLIQMFAMEPNSRNTLT